MATHIDELCGDYASVVHWNRAAIQADLKFYAREGAANIYTGYRQHDYHFVIYGALFLGQIAPALEAVRGLRETTPEAVLRIPSPPMADFFESYLSFEPHVLIRFGRWRDCTELALPHDQTLYCTLTAFTWYARALGHAALGAVPEAEAAQTSFREACARVPKTRLLHNNRVIDLLDIADAMLDGEILYRKGAQDAAFDRLRRAVALEDGLPYDEPWGWMQPARHALGALLFEQGRVAEAEHVFREDLGLAGKMRRATVHPDNVWALKGLHDCLAARGEKTESVHVAQRLALAQARADTPVRAPCGCARAAMASE
jgi:tetratricopeptide (TPR) repeat protein